MKTQSSETWILVTFFFLCVFNIYIYGPIIEVEDNIFKLEYIWMHSQARILRQCHEVDSDQPFQM